jgi:hypothetical protein
MGIYRWDTFLMEDFPFPIVGKIACHYLNAGGCNQRTRHGGGRPSGEQENIMDLSENIWYLQS